MMRIKSLSSEVQVNGDCLVSRYAQGQRTDRRSFTALRSSMLDVDGQVVSADVLVQRVEQLLGTIDARDTVTGPREAVAAPTLDAPIHGMRLIQREIHAPDLNAPGARGGQVGTFVKRVVRKLTSWYVEPRWILQQQLDGESIEFASRAYNSISRIEAELDELRRQNTRLKLQLVDSNERASRLRHHQGELEERVEAHETLLGGVAMQDEVRPLSQEVTALLERLGAIGASGANINYAEFEDYFRGDSDEVEQSQRRYLSLFPPAGERGRIVDIGCGRGEMLAVLEEAGHEVMGVDLDLGMVEICKAKGLPAVVDDGIHFLSQTEPDSLKGIFCAQVVEHLITPEMEQLIVLALRSLRVGGVVVIETINPRSSFALGNHFYADTSHVRPVHPETLRFICEQIGFRTVQLEERSPHPTLALASGLPGGSVGAALGELLGSVFGYQDYVIVATK
jgi:2-polyprenyl-3-methyl-5-hydroxy-6-metoxy-1,4-benzoquinol methylase